MKFPFVSRLTVDAIDRMLTASRADNAALQARFDALLEKYHALRLTGAVPVVTPSYEPEEPSAIDEAITAKAGRNPGLRRYLTHWAKAERQKEGMDDETVARAILHWQGADD